MRLDIVTNAAEAIGAFRSLAERHRAAVPMITIYRPTTTDFPGRWVAKIALTIPKFDQITDFVLSGDTLEELRTAIPPEATCLPRSEGDDPVIEETWLL